MAKGFTTDTMIMNIEEREEKFHLEFYIFL